MYIAMFFMDITLFYLIPLVLSVVLYTLIAVMLLFTAPRTFNDGTVRNQARLQVVKLFWRIQKMINSPHLLAGNI